MRAVLTLVDAGTVIGLLRGGSQMTLYRLPEACVWAQVLTGL